MSDLALGICLIVAVFFAGAIRAYIDRNIAIFYVSTSAVVILSVSLMLNELGVFYSWVEIGFAVLLAIGGTALEAFNTNHPSDDIALSKSNI